MCLTEPEIKIVPLGTKFDHTIHSYMRFTIAMANFFATSVVYTLWPIYFRSKQNSILPNFHKVLFHVMCKWWSSRQKFSRLLKYQSMWLIYLYLVLHHNLKKKHSFNLIHTCSCKDFQFEISSFINAYKNSQIPNTVLYSLTIFR